MKMPRRRLVLAVAATLVLAAVIGWFMTTGEEPNLQRFRQIQVGMRLGDAEKLFPKGRQSYVDNVNGDLASWNWSPEQDGSIDVVVHVWVDEDRRVTRATYQSWSTFDYWLNDNVLSRVGFGYAAGTRVISIP